MSKQIIESYGPYHNAEGIALAIRDKIREGYRVECFSVTNVPTLTNAGAYTAFVLYSSPDEKPTKEEPKKRKTYMEDFFEKFPNAPRDPKGGPQVCPGKIYVGAETDEGDCSIGCVKCWNREMED